MDRPNILRRSHRIALVPLVVIGWTLVLMCVAAADPCPPLDASCAVSQAGGTVSGGVAQNGGVVGGTVTQTGGTVGGAVGGTVGGTVTQTTGTVGGAVDQNTGATPHAPGTVVGALSGGKSGQVPGTQDSGTTTTTTVTGVTPTGEGTHSAGGGTQGPSGGGRHVGAARSGVAPLTSAGTAPTRGGAASGADLSQPSPHDRSDPVGALLRGEIALARTVAFPAALILLVTGFLLMQDRIDRKDPKLALAPTRTEYLTFS
jgi:hypothetical protein